MAPIGSNKIKFVNFPAIKNLKQTIYALVCVVVFSIATQINAGPLDISNVPLELTPSVAPNVFILSNDSASMDWEILTRDALNGGRFNAPGLDGSGLPTEITQREDDGDPGDANCLTESSAAGGYAYIVAFPTNTSSPTVAGSENCFVADDDAWRARSFSFNPLYFDPSKEYSPWSGVDINGNPFGDASITNAPDDPFDPQHFIDLTLHKAGMDASGNRINGDGFKYYGEWIDANNDGIAQDSEMPQEFLIKNEAALQQKFANWFTYYRKREFVAKAITGRLVAGNSSARIGYATTNQNASNGVAVKLLNQSPRIGDKKLILDEIYKTNSIGGSPLRTSLGKVGRYFECLSGDIFNSTSNSNPGDAVCPVEAAPTGACQRNATIVITDSTYDGVAPSVGNADGDNNTDFDGGAFADSFSNTLADVAIHYYERDLHSSLVDDVPVTNIDLNRDPSTPTLQAGDKLQQHLETNVIGIGLQGIGTISANPSPPSSAASPAWPDPSTLDGMADDLRHTAFNGRGDFFTTDDLDQLQTDVQTVFTRAATNESSTSSVAFNTQNITEDTLVFRTFSNLGNNSGELAAQRVNTDGTFNEDPITGNPIFEWSAARELDDLPISSRLILTYSDESPRGGRVFDAVAANGLTNNQKTTLASAPSPPPANVSPTSAITPIRVNYLRGDTSNEGVSYDDGEMRIRAPRSTSTDNITTGGKIGDIVHSAPVFVGEPPFASRFGGEFPNTSGNSYFEFVVANRTREQLVYVGANDGMLHAFKVADGVEKFAYIPNVLLGDIPLYTDPDYNHRFFVDATPSINDAYILPTGSASSREWRTVLINGLGAGGKGYFALDITDPTSFDTNTVMWEFTEKDDGGVGASDLGFTFSKPVIAMSNVEAANGDNKWVAIFGNGFNSTSTDGNAVIYILFIEEGFNGWADVGDFIKIDTGIGKTTSVDGSTPNGIAGVRGIDADGDGTVDRLYAGDLQGNVYVVDISSGNASNWSNLSNTKVLLQAKYSSGFPRTTPQPITNQPTVIKHPTADGFIIVVGTGSFFTKDDATSTGIQTLYGLWDDTLGTNLPIELNSTTSELVEQTLTTSIDNGLEVRTVTSNPVPWDNTGSNQVRGWYIDFDVPPPSGTGIQFPGERPIRNLQLRSNQLFFSTVIPQEGTICAPPPGGFGLSIDPVTGGSGSDVIFDINIDGVFNADDNLNDLSGITNIIVGTRFESTPSDSTFVGDYRVTQLSNKTLDRILVNPDLDDGLGSLLGRHSWKEIRFD